MVMEKHEKPVEVAGEMQDKSGLAGVTVSSSEPERENAMLGQDINGRRSGTAGKPGRRYRRSRGNWG